MKYISTRSRTSSHRFLDVLVAGLAPDGGLFVPESYPKITPSDLDAWQTLSYPELAYRIIRLFVDDIPSDILENQIHTTYRTDLFSQASITPLEKLDDYLYLQGLCHGPTFAFKDIGLQLLGAWFEYVLQQKNQPLNIIGATSGDTGSAAEYALRNKQGIHVFMLSPEGKMSEFQQAQMYTLQDSNIHNIAIEGVFDDCQDIVKAIQQDSLFKEQYHIGTINSINWARILAQVVYYFYGYFQVATLGHTPISFCVPSGNFGNVFAGHIAKQMGLPIKRLIVATNENDVLHDFFSTGIYRPRKNHSTLATSSPSMDISKASNLERFIFDLMDRKPNIISELWKNLEKFGAFDLSYKSDDIQSRYGFYSGKSTHENRLATIAATDKKTHRLIDPHTADAVYVASQLKQPNENIIVEETASPIKFIKTIEAATGRRPVLPEKVAHLTQLPQRVMTFPAHAELIKDFIRQTLQSAFPQPRK